LAQTSLLPLPTNITGKPRCLPGSGAFVFKKRRPGWGALSLYLAYLAAAAVVVVIAAVVAAVDGAVVAAVAEQQDQNNDPPPVVVQTATETIVITAHKSTSRNFLRVCCPHSMVFRRRFFVQRELKLSQRIHQSGLAGGLFVLDLDDLRRAACHHSVGSHISHHDGTGSDHRVMTDAAALDDHGVGADQHIVLNDDRSCGSGLNNACQNGAGAHMAVLAHGGATAQNSAHIDHGSVTDHRADVDDGAHHNDGIFADLHLLPDNGTGLDAGRNVLHIQHGDGGVAAVVLDLNMGKLVCLKNGSHIPPVAEHDLAALPGGEFMAVGERNRSLFPDIDLHRGLFFGGADIFDDFLCVHGSLSLE